ncbi:MAG: hypothetical protein HYV09_39750 [Deltaproteobacteria bacterium]|nr:hypothetical protein [Deltaproteobacteria bacterium]
MIVLLGVVGCGGTKEEPKTPESTVKATKVEPAPTATPTTTETKAEEKAEKKAEKAEEKAEKKAEKKKSAKEVVTASGAVFMFSLADSEGAKKAVDEDCGKKAKKDDKKLESCKKDAEAAGANEGIRFEKDDKGDWYWVSFGKEKDKEVVYNKVKFTVGDEAEGKLTLKPEGKDQGKKAMKTLPKEVVLEVPDESTVVMQDPKKGKLVYKKK